MVRTLAAWEDQPISDHEKALHRSWCSGLDSDSNWPEFTLSDTKILIIKIIILRPLKCLTAVLTLLHHKGAAVSAEQQSHLHQHLLQEAPSIVVTSESPNIDSNTQVFETNIKRFQPSCSIWNYFLIMCLFSQGSLLTPLSTESGILTRWSHHQLAPVNVEMLHLGTGDVFVNFNMHSFTFRLKINK